MWNLPGSGIESMTPALAGGLLFTVPPGKPCFILVFKKAINEVFICHKSRQHFSHLQLADTAQIPSLCLSETMDG